jgi:hypothetical protein
LEAFVVVCLLIILSGCAGMEFSIWALPMWHVFA